MIEVYSKHNFLEYATKNNIIDDTVEQIPDYFICIDSTGGETGIQYFKKPHPNVLQLKFDDVNEDCVRWGDDIQSYYSGIGPSEKDLDILFEFLNKRDKTCPLHVYCAKGQSRSRAVKDFLTGNVKKVIHPESAYLKILEGLRKRDELSTTKLAV